MTVICKTISEWKNYQKTIPSRCRIGFVPTMGNFHRGHQSLFKRASLENDIAVVSSFVNPTQFNQTSDFENYPKTFEADLELIHQLNIDAFFCPDYQEVYPDNYRFILTEQQDSLLMEGKHRPGHFNGVLTVVMKLLCLIQPQRAYFGEKDFQQLKLIKDMVNAFFLNTEIIACPTIRNSSGLALSSRNLRLSKNALMKASKFSNLLKKESESTTKIAEMLNSQNFKVDYIEEHFGRRFGAVWLEGIRLIDNVKISIER